MSKRDVFALIALSAYFSLRFGLPIALGAAVAVLIGQAVFAGACA